jgi:hypothetical protein
MAFEVERTPAIPDLLYATAVSPPNRSGGRGTVCVSGLPESAPKTNLQLEQVYHIGSGEARVDATARPPDDWGSSPDACGGLFLSGTELETRMTAPMTHVDKETFGPWTIVTGASSGFDLPMKLMAVEQCVAEGLTALKANQATHIAGQRNRIMATLIPGSVMWKMMDTTLARALAKRQPPAVQTS